MPLILHYNTGNLYSEIARACQEERRIDVHAASTIASHWQSPQNEGLTALSTGHAAWESMVPQTIAEALQELVTVESESYGSYKEGLDNFLRRAELCALLDYLEGVAIITKL